MNIKVVIIWIFAIIMFLGIGLLGFFNRDLLKQPVLEDEPVVPKTQYITKNCRGSNDYGEITYTFNLNSETNNIEKLFVKYKGVMENVDLYTTALNINNVVNNKRINGVTAQIYGTSSNVELGLNVNLLGYDSQSLSELRESLLSMGMVVDNINDYNNYIITIDSTTGITFICD